jgi:hypothetical protein
MACTLRHLQEKEQYLRPRKSSLNKAKGISKEDGWYVIWWYE